MSPFDDKLDGRPPSDIADHNEENYYDDIRSWLKGGKSPNGKSYKAEFSKGGETATVSIIYNDIPENHRIIGFSHKGEEVILDELVMTDRERAEYSAKEGYMKGMDRNEFWKKYQRVDFQTAD